MTGIWDFLSLLLSLLLLAAFFIVPISALIWFVVMIIKLKGCPKEDTESFSKLKKLFIASAVTFGAVTAGIIYLVVSFAVGIMYM